MIIHVQSSAEAEPDGLWAQFGTERLVFEDDDAEEAADAAGVDGGGVAVRRVPARREELHVVVQNGREFQRHHPEVYVLHDRGRYLLVQLDPARAPRLASEAPSDYGVFPLTTSRVIFERRPPAPRVPDPRVQALVDQLSRARFRTNLAALVSFNTRHSASAGFRAAADLATAQLSGLGYATRSEDVEVDGGTSRNIIAELPGDGEDVILVTAHLDSINDDNGPAAPAPGADDNASGSAGLLEIAHVFREHRGGVGLRLILFGGEEQGLLGSKQYVDGLSTADRAKIRAVVNMDMIASLNQTPASVLLEGAPVSQAVIDGLHAAASTYTRLVVDASTNNPDASDHVPFIDAQIPAVLTIEGLDRANERVHTAADTLAHIDHDLALAILRMNVAFVAEALG